MKKMFSLVLALVMALSLTTIAWGADVTTSADFADAVEAGGTVTLGADITLTSADWTDNNTIKVTSDVVINLNGYDLDASASTRRPFELYNGANLTIVANADETVTVGKYGLVYIPDGASDVTLTGGNYVGNTDKGAFIKPKGDEAIKITLTGVNYTDSSAKNWLIDGTTYDGPSRLTIEVNGGEYTVYTGITAHYADITVKNAVFNVKNVGIESGLGSTALVENCTITASGGDNAGSPTTALVASGGGSMTVKGGTYTGSDNASTDGKNALAIYTSGGSITVESGTFDGDVNAITQTGDYEIEITGGTVTGDFKTSGTLADDVDVTVSGGTFTTTDAAAQDAIKSYVVPGKTVTIAGDTVVKNTDGSVAVNPVAQVGTTKYETVAEAIAAANGAPVVLLDDTATIPAGYEVVSDGAGGFVVVVDVAHTSSVSGLYAKATSKDAVKQENITLNFFKAVDNEVDEDTGAYVADGNVEYYMIAGVITKYAKVATVAAADMVIYTDAACKNVYMYLDAIDPVYYGDGAVVTNFGKACGQYTDAKTAGYNAKATYYTAFDELYVGAEAGAAYTKQLLVNGVLVQVNDAPTTLIKNAHKAIITTDKTGKVESIKCAVCGVAAIKAGNFASVPTNAVIEMQEGNAYWYWPVVGGIVVGGTTGSTVQSAQTFDAGIAMYVGMSVMAAAGSAVVIGKKKD